MEPPEVGEAVVVRVYVLMTKLAVTDLLLFMVTVQVVAAPLQSPAHPVKLYPVAGVAVRVTDAPKL